MRFKAVISKADGGGETIELDAPTRLEAGRLLRGQGAAVLSIEEVKGERQFALPSFISGRISGRDRIMFARNLAAMLSAGMPLSRSLSALEGQAKAGRFKTVLGELGKSVERGESLSGALKSSGDAFSDVFVAMVHAGEESGGLPNALTIVADQLEKSSNLKKKLRGALIYPGIIFAAMGLVGIVMMTFVVPTLTATFTELGVELPLSTKLVLTASNFVANNLILITILFFAALALAIRAFRSPQGKRSFDHLLLRLPVVAPIVREVNAAITARTVSSLVSAGVDMVEALTITATIHSNTVYRDVLVSAASQVQSGAPLSAILKSHPKLYPVLLSSVAEVGEETGKLSTMFMNTALFYEEEVDRVTKNLSTIVEPVLMIFIGAGVGFFAISMISPMYSVVDKL